MSSSWQTRFPNGSGQSGKPLSNFDRGEIAQPQSVPTNPYNFPDWKDQKMFLKNRKNPKSVFPGEKIIDVEEEEMDIGRMVKVRGKTSARVTETFGCPFSV